MHVLLGGGFEKCLTFSFFVKVFLVIGFPRDILFYKNIQEWWNGSFVVNSDFFQQKVFGSEIIYHFKASIYANVLW